MKRVLVFGKTGQLAHCLAETMPDQTDAIFLDRQSADLSALPDFDQILEENAPDLVILAAAYTAVEKAEDEPDVANQVNAVNPSRLGAACRRMGVPIVHFSTDYVFDGKLGRPLSEEDPVHPLGAYGQSKLAGEVGLLDSGAQAFVFRTSWVFSSYGHNFLKTMLSVASKTRDLRVVADTFGNPTSAHDLAEAVWRAATQIGKAPQGIYHLTGNCNPDEKVSWHSFAQRIFQAAAEKGLLRDVRCDPISAVEYPSKVDRPADTRLECSKYQGIFGYSMPHWTSGVDSVLARVAAR
ncbi:MAG: dTDP-4-dehydrorhamnose reductase [Mesorhizobium sp.]|uniref:dTDP-4-dehydrorhamnose reductase n=1 Tax=Mesorhizobium sp. TaxID=1871066 RepID=UPI00121CDB61|nr:dTDP-4-dehydrorhamnose reductase [Mesorhizobium sp.]TIQ29127.1 MAG: dTDP-4-dehydrorhamnose reductase [Mesorhizobium sp.]